MTPGHLESLFSRFRTDGDLDALARVFDETAPELLRVAMHLASRPEDAEDLLQQTFVTAIQRARSFDRKRSLVAWLIGILAKHARNAGRKKAVPTRSGLEATDRQGVVDTVLDREQRSAVQTAIEDLPEPYRSVLAQHLQEGRSGSEIAQRLRRAPGTIRSQIHRGLQLLRRALPKGLIGGGALCVTETRGIAAIRSEVLTLAGSSSTTLLGIGGLIMTRKLVSVAATLLLVSGSLVWIGLTSRSTEGGRESGLSPTGIGVIGTEEAGETRQARPMDRQEVVTSDFLPPPVDLENADRDLDLFGLVLDSSHDPVAGAEVSAIEFPWRRVITMNIEGARDVARVLATTRTALDGTFLLRLSRGDAVHLRVTHDSYATEEVPGCLAGERVCIELAAPASLEVLVRDQDSAPAHDVEAHFMRWLGMTTCDERVGSTDEDGRVVFHDVPPGYASVSVSHPTMGSPRAKGVTVTSGESVRLEFTMLVGRTIRGRVTDATTGLPIAEARVGSNWSMYRPVSTDENGWYSSPNWIGDGIRDLHVVHPEYGRAGKEVPAQGLLDFALSPGDRARGTVLSDADETVSGALISAIASRDQFGRQQIDTRSTTSDAAGEFQLRGLRREMPHTLVVQARGHGRLLLDFDPHPLAPGLIDLGKIRLPAPRSIEGIALDADGKPMPRESVTVTGHNLDRRKLRPGREEDAVLHDYGTTETRFTDDLGRFRFPDLSPGEYRVELASDGRSPVIESILVPDDRDVLNVRLQATAGRILTVLVTDSAGQPIESAYVSAHLPIRHDPMNQHTDASGRVRFEGLPDCEVWIRASENGYSSPPAQVVLPDQQQLELTLHRSGTLQGQVMGLTGEPLAGLQLKAMVDGKDRSWAFTDEDGRFEVAVPVGPPIDLIVTGRRLLENDLDEKMEWSAFRGQLEGLIAPLSDLVIRAESTRFDRSVTVEVLDPDGKPLPGACVTVSGELNHRDAVDTDARGIAIVEDLPDRSVTLGAHNLRIVNSLDEMQSSPWVDTIPDGQQVTLRLRRMAPLAGQLLDPDLRPTSKVRVEAISADGDRFFERTDEAGRFLFRLPAGQTYTLTASVLTSDLRALRGHVDGVTPGNREITLRLEE